MTTIEKVNAVANTIDQVAVAGHENWSMMLGCWQTLQEIKKELMQIEAEKTAHEQRDQENTADPV